MGLLTQAGFLDRAECEAIRAEYDTALVAKTLSPRGTAVTDADIELIHPVGELAAKIAALLRTAHPSLPDMTVDYAAYTRMTVGGSHSLHADAVLKNGKPNHTPWRVASAVLYLNDCGSDFKGGAIRFPGLGQTVEPRAGLLIGFLTDWEHRHLVGQVTSGHRDAVIFWFMDAAKGRSGLPTVEAIPEKERPEECRFVGGLILPEERILLNLDHARRWTKCLSPDRPLGESVCPCMGCGPKCRGYQLDGTQAPAASPTPTMPIPEVRHLLYHLLPVTGPIWRAGVDQLRARWNLFNGRKCVAIATGPSFEFTVDGTPKRFTLESPEVVRDYLPPDCDVIEVPNSPAVREVASWRLQWSRILDTAGDNDAILYAHAKGVSRLPNDPVQRWAELLYTLSLDHWPLVSDLLTRYPIVGSFKTHGHRQGEFVLPWHFTGTFFWTRAGDFRQRNWRQVTPDWWGERIFKTWSNEAWMGLAFAPSEAGVIFKDDPNPLNLYLKATWPNVEVEYRQWLAKNPPSGSLLPAHDLPTSPALPTA